jgi:hypothetical protein
MLVPPPAKKKATQYFPNRTAKVEETNIDDSTTQRSGFQKVCNIEQSSNGSRRNVLLFFQQEAVDAQRKLDSALHPL